MSKKKAPTKAESQYMDRVCSIGCIVCQNLGYGASPAEFHHTRASAGGGQKSDVKKGIPLCPQHHRLGGYGVAYHAGAKEFERLYGSEEELVMQVHKILGVIK